MAEYDNNMRGVAFANEYKKSDNHPSYRGTLEIDGVPYKQSIWIKVAKNGKKFLSFSYEKADEVAVRSKPAPAPTLDEVKDDLDDFVPF